jgi:hypothetical protein
VRRGVAVEGVDTAHVEGDFDVASGVELPDDGSDFAESEDTPEGGGDRALGVICGGESGIVSWESGDAASAEAGSTAGKDEVPVEAGSTEGGDEATAGAGCI